MALTARASVVHSETQGPLSRADFQPVALRGFGDGRNAYPHSMAWFEGALYVGTTRDNLCLVKARHPFNMKCWPVQCPDPPDPRAHRAQIWRYDPATAHWEQVHVSPMIQRDGREVMRDIGYRGMRVYQGRGDSRPVLYLSSWSATGARIMRSEDGRTFEDKGEPGLGHPSMVCFRSLQSFNGRLYTTPVGRAGRGPNEAELPLIIECDDPAGGTWRPVNIPGFGDPENLGVFEMAEFDGHLYAGTVNDANGFQLWKTRAEGRPPYAWKRVLTSGAFRGMDNESVLSLCPFNGALYVGTGIMGGGYNRYHRVGPAASEVIRVFPDDRWELLVGAPRITPDGMKVPLSGLGPGFNNFFNGYTWRMCVHEGWLYVSTYNWGCFIPYLTLEGWPEPVVRYIRKRGVNTFASEVGGCELWRTRDGAHWYPVDRAGFGTPFNYGIRTMSSTPHGLFLGTANPFGPQVGVETESGWTYRPNDRGGCEVWLGRPPEAGRDDTAPPVAVRSGNAEQEALRGLFYRVDRECFAEWTRDFYEDSGFDQMGCWTGATATLKQACEDLMDRLLGMAPLPDGPILDVEIGRGGSTRRLVRLFGADRITGSGYRLEAWKDLSREFPGLTLLETPSAPLDLESGRFGALISVERPGSFPDRAAFLREALRVLRPGGRLYLADTLYSRTGELTDWTRHRRNHLRDPKAYRTLLAEIGFQGIETEDATEACVLGYRDYMLRTCLERFRAGQIDTETFNGIMANLNRNLLFLNYYILAVALKP